MPKPKSTVVYPPSKTIPGQSLYPAELMARHLAGTLPPIDHSSKYEYHYDEDGNQIGEPMPLEAHEIHKMAVALRKRQYQEAIEHRKQQAEKERAEIIAAYLEEQRAVASASHPDTPDGPQNPAPEPPATPSGSRAKKKG